MSYRKPNLPISSLAVFMNCTARLRAMTLWRSPLLCRLRRVRPAAPKSLCFCSAGGEAQERGDLYGHGLAALGIEPERMLMITAAKEKDLLWTLGEAVASGAFGAVVGSLGPRERLYGFAASRRLKLRAAASGTPLFLLRHRSNGGATAAQGRWRVSTLPSRSEGEHAGYTLLGPPRLQLTLERMGGLPPQSWEMEFDGMAALLEDRPARCPSVPPIMRTLPRSSRMV